MWFGTFFIRSLRLSLIVALYWLPVLLVVNYAAYQIFEFFESEPIALIMVIILLVQPYFVIQVIMAIRAGMLALKVTRATDLGMLGTVTVRVMRFNLILVWAVTALFGLATTITALRYTGSTWLTDAGAAFAFGSKDEMLNLLRVLGDFPVILLSGWILGGSIAIGLMGVATAGASAMASSRPPNHHNIWGIASEFVHLFLLSVILLLIPVIGFVAIVGDISITLSGLLELNQYVQYGIAVYVLWAVCAVSAGIALAYANTVEHEAAEHEALMAAMAGAAPSQGVDLKALRESRMKN